MEEDCSGTVSEVLAGRATRRSAAGTLGAGAGLALLAAALGGRGAAAQEATPAAAGGGPGGYLVIRRYRLQPGASYDELVRRVVAGFVPIIEAVPGFVEYFFVDPGDGGHVAVSVFADEAGANRSTDAAVGWAEQNVPDLVQLPPIEVVGGVVRLHSVGAGMAMAGTPVP